TTKDHEITRMMSFCERKNIELQLINHFTLTSKKHNNYTFSRPPDCAACNRIRLLSEGYLKPCLHSDEEIKIDFHDIETSLKKAIENKPAKGGCCSNRSMLEIGG
ncbi:MAG: molybdenum cofactor biosynthesis protein MoeA, partial [Spirochaetota bacterium]